MREVRDFKHFSDRDFYNDLLQVPWEISPLSLILMNVGVFGSRSSLKFLMHTHLSDIKELKLMPSPWMTTIIKNEIRNRDYHKKKAIKHNSKYHWEMYKKSGNKVNINIRKINLNILLIKSVIVRMLKTQRKAGL